MTSLPSKILNKKLWLIIALTLTMTGFIFALVGTYRPDERVPEDLVFKTYPDIRDELNSFFNRTQVTPDEDAQNKLIEDYTVRGYLLRPLREVPTRGYPVVIWMHGFGVNAELQLNIPRQLAKAGFLVLAINQPGHGNSGGYWDMGIQTLLGVYSAVRWITTDSSYAPQINPQHVGVSGHSMGGIATTRAGIFDNWTNPQTGNPVGTGGQIRSCCAVYCWDDLKLMSTRLIEQFLKIENIWSHPTILKTLDHWRWLSNYDASVLEEEVRLRSVSNFIDASNIGNYYLITGEDDELTSPMAQYFLMANSTKSQAGVAQVNWEEIQSSVEQSADETWSYGEIAANNARRLTLLPNMGHIGEAFSKRVCERLVNWFTDSMECEDIDRVFPPGNLAWQWPFLLKLAGWTLIVAAIPIGILSITAYALEKLDHRKQGFHRNTNQKVINDGGWKCKETLVIVGACIGAIGIPGLLTLNSATHFWIIDLLVPRILVAGEVLLILGICIDILWKKQDRDLFKDAGLTRVSALHFLTPITALILWVAVLAAASGIQLPYLLPRPSSTQLTTEVFGLFGIFFLLNLAVEIIFRGIVQVRLLGQKEGRREQWGLILRSALLSGISLGIGFGLNIVLGFGPLFVYAPYLVLGIFGCLVALFFVLGVLDAWLFQRTKTVWTPILLNTIICVLVIAGKLIMPYA